MSLQYPSDGTLKESYLPLQYCVVRRHITSSKHQQQELPVLVCIAFVPRETELWNSRAAWATS